MREVFFVCIESGVPGNLASNLDQGPASMLICFSIVGFMVFNVGKWRCAYPSLGTLGTRLTVEHLYSFCFG